MSAREPVACGRNPSCDVIYTDGHGPVSDQAMLAAEARAGVAEARVEAVRELHCAQYTRCVDEDGTPEEYCEHCNTEFPCATIRALDEVL